MTPDAGGVPDLQSLIPIHIPGVGASRSLCSYVVAILEHEGTNANERLCDSIGLKGLATLAVRETIRRGSLPPPSAPRGRAPLVNRLLKGEMRVGTWNSKQCVDTLRAYGLWSTLQQA
jgi:hypothetical protein